MVFFLFWSFAPICIASSHTKKNSTESRYSLAEFNGHVEKKWEHLQIHRNWKWAEFWCEKKVIIHKFLRRPKWLLDLNFGSEIIQKKKETKNPSMAHFFPVHLYKFIFNQRIKTNKFLKIQRSLYRTTSTTFKAVESTGNQFPINWLAEPVISIFRIRLSVVQWFIDCI